MSGNRKTGGSHNKGGGGAQQDPAIANYIKNVYNTAGTTTKQGLSKDEKIALKEAEEEYKRRGGFKRIFPTIDFNYYKQFFEEDRPLNYFLDAKLMHKQR